MQIIKAILCLIPAILLFLLSLLKGKNKEQAKIINKQENEIKLAKENINAIKESSTVTFPDASRKLRAKTKRNNNK